MKKFLVLFALTVLFCINNQSDVNLAIMVNDKAKCQVNAFTRYCIELEAGQYVFEAIPINDRTVDPVRTGLYVLEEDTNYTWNIGVEPKK
jgi:hypothetical protein